MTRGLPFSIVFHILVTALVLVYGNAVNRTPPRPVRSINVQMVRLPETKPPEKTLEQPVVEPEVQQPKPEIKPEQPPKEKPEPERKKPEPKPREEVKAVEPEVKDDPPAEAEPAPALMVSGPSVTTDDADFPFAWYAQRVEGLVWRNFKPRQINFGRNAMISCAVHFKIAKNGAVSQVTLVRNSGVGVFDREALRAVQTTKLPPLPPQYRGTSLGVTFIFNLEPGS